MKNFILLLSLFLMISLPVVLPACKSGQASNSQGYFIEVGKVFVKTNLQKLFPDANFSRDSVQVSKVFKQDFLRQLLHLKARNFLTEKGSITLDKVDFYAQVSWERISESVRISVVGRCRSPRDSL